MNTQPILSLKNGQSLDLSRPQIMGILNITPDSFSDGGKYQHIDQAVERALQMRHDGASIIDIGGESTRPHANKISLAQELDRVIPVVQALKPYDLILSIDTSQPEVICQAVQAGASIWNDVRALKRPYAIETAVQLDIPVIFMHNRGEPDTMNDLAHYQDIILEVKHELLQRIDLAIAAGVKKQHIIADIGFGFAKDTEQNIYLLQNFSAFKTLGYPLLAGLSRKRFIGEILNGAVATERDIASATAHLFCIQQGASIVRTHHVKAMADMLAVWKSVGEPTIIADSFI